MSRRDAIARLRTRLDEVRAALGAHLDEFMGLLTRLSDPDRRDSAAWNQLVVLIFDLVPPETGVHREFVPDDERGGSVAEEVDRTAAGSAADWAAADWAAVAEEARALLATLDEPRPEDIFAAVRARILRAPMHRAADLPDAAADRPDLIRLPLDDGDVVVPAFQFDQSGLPHPVVLEINRLLDAERDAWAVADWWLSDNARLGAAPSALLGRTDDDRLMAAARSVRARI